MWLKKVFIKNGFAKLGFKQQVRQMDNNLRKFQHSASVFGQKPNIFLVFGLCFWPNVKMQLWSFTATIIVK